MTNMLIQASDLAETASNDVWPHSFFGWIWLIVVGLVLGLVAKALIPGRQNIPLWLTILAGIGGSVLGNYLSVVFGVRHTNGIDWFRHLFQIIGAVVLVAIITPLWGAIKGKKTPDVREVKQSQ